MDYSGQTTKRRKHNQEEEEHHQLDCLSLDIALDILSRLSIKSVIQSRFVCRSWYTLSHHPDLISMHLERATSKQQQSSYIIFHCDYPMRNHLGFVELANLDNQTERVRKFSIPFADSMPEFSIIGSSNGFLCLLDSLLVETIYVYNPFTRDYKQLPKSTVFQDEIVKYGFGYDHTSKDHKVIKIVYYPSSYDLDDPVRPSLLRALLYRRHRSIVQVYSLSRNSWRSIGEMPYKLDRVASSGVLVNGNLHWMSERGKYNGRLDWLMISFDLASESFRVVPKCCFRRRSCRAYHCQVADLGGSLAVAVPVLYGNGAIDIWVMKEYGVEESWVKEITVGAYVPMLISPEMHLGYQIWKRFLGAKFVRVMCLLETGEVLLEYRGGTLVSYNPANGAFKHIVFEGMPHVFGTIVHVGSLSSTSFTS